MLALREPRQGVDCNVYID